MVLFIGILFWTGYDILILFFVASIPIVLISSLLGTVYFIASVSVYAIIAALLRKRIILTFASIIIIFGIGYISPILINKLHPYQRNRIETFLYPDKDPLGKGYNVIQSKLAVGSGGLVGKGFLQGTQTQLRYIPKQWTDFIFCVPAEEFGFVGGALVIILLMSLVLKAVKTAFRSRQFIFQYCFLRSGDNSRLPYGYKCRYGSRFNSRYGHPPAFYELRRLIINRKFCYGRFPLECLPCKQTNKNQKADPGFIKR